MGTEAGNPGVNKRDRKDTQKKAKEILKQADATDVSSAGEASVKEAKSA